MTDLKAIQFKRTKTAGAKPAAEKLLEGELAINLKDRTLFTKDDKGTVIDLGFAKGGQVDGDINQTGNFTTTGTISGNKVVSTQAPVDAEDLTRKDYVDQEIKKIIGDSQTNIDDLEKKVTLVDTKVDQNDQKQTEAVNTVKSSVSNLDTKVDQNDQKQTEALISAITGVNSKVDNGLNLKLDKTGGTLTGNLNITGQLQVGQSTHLGDGNILGPSWTLGGGNLYSHIDAGLNSKFNVTGGVLNGDLTANTIISDAGAITIKDSPNGNHHLWFNSRDGGEKGLIYATAEGVLHVRSGTNGSVGHVQIDSGLLHCTGNLTVAGTTNFGSNITFSSGITTNGNSTFNGQNDFGGNSNYSGGITFIGVNRTQYPISHTDGRPSSSGDPLQLRRVTTWSQGNWMYEAATSSQGGITDGIAWFLNSTGSSSSLFSISSKGQIGIGPDNSGGAVVYKTGDIRGSAWGGGTLKEWLEARGIK